MERLFELLFKYRPAVFSRGDLLFAPPWPLALVLALGALTLVLVALAYRRARSDLRLRDRLVLLGLRTRPGPKLISNRRPL